MTITMPMNDPFDFVDPDLTPAQRASRVIFLLAILAVCMLDLFVWRP